MAKYKDSFCISHPYRFRVVGKHLTVSKYRMGKYGPVFVDEWEFDLES